MKANLLLLFCTNISNRPAPRHAPVLAGHAPEYMDITGDGKVNAFDVVALMRMLNEDLIFVLICE